MAFELDIIHWLQDMRSPMIDFFFEFWTFFGEEYIIIGVLGMLYWCYDKRVGEAIGITVFASLAVNSFLKVLIARPRPFLVDDDIVNIRPETSGGYSFPSGHTQGAGTLFLSIAAWLKKRWITIISVIIVVMVAISRMYIGVHYLSDVLTSILLSFGFAYGGYYLLNKKDFLKKYRYWIIALFSIILLGSYAFFLFTSNDLTSIDSELLHGNVNDLAKMVASILGFILGITLERSRIHFKNHRHFWKNAIRLILGFVVVVSIRVLLKLFFSIFVSFEEFSELSKTEATWVIVFDFIRYFAMVYVAIGVYPMVFKKISI